MWFESVYFSRSTIIVSNSCPSYSCQEVARSLAGTSESAREFWKEKSSREFRKEKSSNAINPGVSNVKREVKTSLRERERGANVFVPKKGKDSSAALDRRAECARALADHILPKKKRDPALCLPSDAASAIIRDWTTLSARLFVYPFASSADFLSHYAEIGKLSIRIDRNRTSAAHTEEFTRIIISRLLRSLLLFFQLLCSAHQNYRRFSLEMQL